MVVLLVILALVGAIAGILYYLGKKVKNIFRGFNINIPDFAYWILFYFSFVFTVYLRSGLIAVYLAALLLFAFCDIVYLIVNIFGINCRLLSKIYLKGLAVIIISFIISIIWQYNALHPIVKEYNLSLERKIEGGLQVVFISDIHAGTAIRKKQLKYMAKAVNEIEPDIVLLGGDIFDESSTKEDMKNTCRAVGEMHSTYGAYYISGNHDAGLYGDFKQMFMDEGINIIDDGITLIDNKFYLAGRRENVMGTGINERISPDEILKGADKDFPVIMLDHRPVYFDEDTGEDVDLLLCGHTHNGQIFPGNLFIGMFCEQTYGHEVHNGTDVIVSSGFGVWGFPLRSGSRSELVSIHIE